MNDHAMKPSPAAVSPTTALETLDRFASLQDWRREMSDLYAAIRTMAPQAGWAHWRAVRERLFREHPQSPLPEAGRLCFGGVACFDYDPELRFEVALVPAPAREVIAIEAGKDGLIALRPYALTEGLAGRLGRELTLYWIEGYGGGTFLPFGDASNGGETYAGGRYLLDAIKSADLGTTTGGRRILDFNFSYYPSCAYSPEWVCPLSPAENRLPRPVRGGERDAGR